MLIIKESVAKDYEVYNNPIVVNQLMGVRGEDSKPFLYTGQVNEFKPHYLEGVGRVVREDQIGEGQYVNGKLNGFGRVIYASGSSYIGWFKNGKAHGYGKFDLNGGEWKRGYYKQHQQLNPSLTKKQIKKMFKDDDPRCLKKFFEGLYI